MEEEFNIEYSSEGVKKSLEKTKSFVIKHKVILLLIIPLFFAIFFRAYTYDIPMGDDLAVGTMQQNIISQIESQTRQENPNIDEESLNIVVQQRYNEYISQNKQQIDEQTGLLAEQIKSYYQDESGQTYLLAIDPYHYYRQAQNILDHGHVGDEIKDGRPLDNHMIAPNGRFVSNSFHPYIGAKLHKISTWFGNDSLMKTMFILPLIFAALATIPAFFIARKIGGNVGGVVAAFILAIHPVFLGRTPAGFSDTDAYNIFFPLVIIWLFIESFTTTKQKTKLIFGGLAGFASGIFAYAWGGWWYVFDLILASIAIYFIYLLIKYKNNVFKKIKTKNLIKTTVAYVVSSAIFVTIFKNFKSFMAAFKSPMDVVLLKEAARPSLWPNVYTTVAELNTVALTDVISQLGGRLIFTIAIVGILLVLLQKNKKQMEIKYGIIATIWFLGTLYTTTKGIRFIMFMVPVFAIGIGIFSGKVYKFITNWASKELNIKKKLVSGLLILVIVFSMIPLMKSANSTAKGEVPSMNDAWYNALIKIKEETAEDSIITSWWDFGHWFKAIADRAVTFDGASQNRPQAHWVGKALLTNNEEETIGILRMLDCGGNDAYDILLEETEDPLVTKRVIDEIILKDRNAASSVLAQHTLDPEKILEKTHCTPPDAYLITSEDMVGKASVWAHFGSWSFERSFIYNTIRNNNKEDTISIIVENLGYSEEKAASFYTELKGIPEQESNAWISPYPGYMGNAACQDQNSTIVCSNGIVIDLNFDAAFAQTEEGHVPLMFYRDDNQIYENADGTNENLAVAYLPEKSEIVMMSPELMGSTFTDLFYYGGKRLNNFELFDHTNGADGFDIYTWKIKW